MSTFQVVILGAGKIAGLFDSPEDNRYRSHMGALAGNGSFELKGVFDNDLSRAESFVSRWGKGSAFKSLDEVAACEADLCCVCTPDSTHYELLREVSKHSFRAVVCEKPLSLNAADARQIGALFSGRGFVCNYSRSFVDGYRKLKKELIDLLENGEELQTFRLQYFKGLRHSASHFLHWLHQVCPFRIEEGKILRRVEDCSAEDMTVSGQFLARALSSGRTFLFTLEGMDSRIHQPVEMDFVFRERRYRISEREKVHVEVSRLSPNCDFPDYLEFSPTSSESFALNDALPNMYQDIESFLKGHRQTLKADSTDWKVLEICDEILSY